MIKPEEIEVKIEERLQSLRRIISLPEIEKNIDNLLLNSVYNKKFAINIDDILNIIKKYTDIKYSVEMVVEAVKNSKYAEHWEIQYSESKDPIHLKHGGSIFFNPQLYFSFPESKIEEK